jgi:hypothetical protein
VVCCFLITSWLLPSRTKSPASAVGDSPPTSIDLESCTYCNGTGVLSPCQKCNGKGKYKHDRYEGRLVLGAPDSIRYVTRDCDMCGGKGKRGICPHCGGSRKRGRPGTP